jgi:chromosome segregation ATPase
MASIEEQFLKTQADLSAAIAERCDLQANFEKLVADNDTALAAVKAEAEASAAALTEAKAALAALESDKAELLKQIEAAMQGQVSASKEAAKIAASVGCKPAALSPADEGQADNQASAEDIRKAFLGMKPGPDKSAFFAAHRAILTATR